MDALDAGAYAYVFQADVPKTIKVVLWGPLVARELGFDGWDYQDGGETGFVYHTKGRAAKMGLATATLIVVRRLEKAYLTVYLGGYPTDAAQEQRRLECRAMLNEAELLLSRLCNKPIQFQETRELVLVEPTGAAAAEQPASAPRYGRRMTRSTQ